MIRFRHGAIIRHVADAQGKNYPSLGICIVIGHRIAHLANNEGAMHAVHVIDEMGNKQIIHDIKNITLVVDAEE